MSGLDDNPADHLEQRLVILERAAREDVETAELKRLVDAEDDSRWSGRQRARFLLVRSILENRLGLPDKALATIAEARKRSSPQPVGEADLRLSLQAATIHAWRGRGDAARGELLRAVAEMVIADKLDEVSATMAEAARVCQEVHQFDQAILFLDAALEDPKFAGAARVRAQINRMQCLNRLERHAECLDMVAATEAEAEGWPRRRQLLREIEAAKALAGVGSFAKARQALADARRLLPENPHDYDHTDWAEAAVDVEAREKPETALESAEALVRSFAQDHLHLREADARIAYSAMLRHADDVEAALSEAANALRIAIRERSPVVAERARSAILQYDSGGDALDAAPGQVTERYVLAETLGRGGYGVVRRGIDIENGAERAIKIVRLDNRMDAERRRLTLRDARAEIEASMKFRHPGVVRVYNAFVADNSIAIVQDLIVGVSLSNLDASDIATMKKVFARLAHTLHAMHDAGMVHRDLKPTNVIVDDADFPVIIDLGLSILAGDLSADEPVRGTQGYLAPEMLQRSRPAPHPRQDIYAFGRMLDEYLPAAPRAGWSPFRKADKLAGLRAAMVARDPAARPDSLLEVAIELERAMGD